MQEPNTESTNPVTTKSDEKQETKQEIIKEEERVLTRTDMVNLLSLTIGKAVYMTFKKEYLSPEDCDVVRTALKFVDKKMRRLMRRS